MNAELELIRLREVQKTYGRQRVLTIGDLTLRRGQSILLRGSNGSGKSTLLRVLAGISTVDRGEVYRHPILRHRRLGFVPQSGGLYGEMTLRQNLRVRRQLFGLPDAVDGRYLTELGLDTFLDRQVSELSGGYQRLAAIAVTLHAEPRWLLLDEPLSGVDDAMRAVLKDLFAVLKGRLDLCVVAAPSTAGDLAPGLLVEIADGRIS